MLRRLSHIPNLDERKALLAGVQRILVDCSTKSFASDGEKDAFYQKWVKVYEDHFPDLFWLEIENDKDVTGYLTVCPESQQALPLIQPLIRYYDLFSDHFSEFPAHLHINVAPGNQGKGIGRRLIEAAVDELVNRHIKGLHLITSPTANNVLFYRTLDFRFELERKYSEIPLLFMGRTL